MSVSYTHLLGGATFINPISNKKPPNSLILAEGARRILSEGISDSADAKPVSYTHLEVYKRQLDNRELRKQLNERVQALDDALWIKESLLKAMCVQPFIVAEY